MRWSGLHRKAPGISTRRARALRRRIERDRCPDRPGIRHDWRVHPGQPEDPGGWGSIGIVVQCRKCKCVGL